MSSSEEDMECDNSLVAKRKYNIWRNNPNIPVCSLLLYEYIY